MLAVGPEGGLRGEFDTDFKVGFDPFLPSFSPKFARILEFIRSRRLILATFWLTFYKFGLGGEGVPSKFPEPGLGPVSCL
jgi:hypothetical protein